MICSTARLPYREPDPTHLILGEHHGQPAPGVGFSPSKQSLHREKGLITYDGDAHLITVAPTRSGKGTGVIIPNLLHYQGPVVVIDPKGENFMVTARRRREMGHRVIKLDPFGVVDDQSDSFNPLDIFSLAGSDLETDSQSLAELFARGIKGTKDPFWDLNGCGALSGLICYAGGLSDPEKANLVTVVEKFYAEDAINSLACLLDAEGNTMCPFAYQEIAALLQMPEVTRGGVLATTQSYLKAFLSPQVSRTLKQSSFPLKSVVDGDPIDIYIILPPYRIHSHKSLIKLQVAVLLTAVLSRRHRPALRTLFILDEIAQLESFPLLETMLTLAGGYGAWVWMFVQDLAQLQTWYATSWKTLVNSCGVVQAFGFHNRDMAMQWSGYLDHGSHHLRNLRAGEQVLSIHGRGEFRCRRLNYLVDHRFQGRFDANRLYEQPDRGPFPER
ncbi:MAG TPA: type IV secretory system conjugative DNA transfer family protein [Pirellulales bacterium]